VRATNLARTYETSLNLAALTATERGPRGEVLLAHPKIYTDHYGWTVDPGDFEIDVARWSAPIELIRKVIVP
jgi:hypothetical protein